MLFGFGCLLNCAFAVELALRCLLTTAPGADLTLRISMGPSIEPWADSDGYSYSLVWEILLDCSNALRLRAAPDLVVASSIAIPGPSAPALPLNAREL